MERLVHLMKALIAVIALASSAFAQAQAPAPASVAASAPADDVFHGELVAFPGVWQFQLGKAGIILVSDDELLALADPDRKINMSLGHQPNERSLREVCEQAKAAGQRTLIVAFDHFFAQYRPGQGDKPRKLTPDTDEYIRLIGGVSKFAAGYGLGLELSLLSPLELGPAARATTGESGLWMQYRKGLRDPKTGTYSVELWRQQLWANNKGPIRIEEAGVRVLAFRQKTISQSYLYVDPSWIEDITATAKVEVLSGPTGGNQNLRVRIHGTGGVGQAGLDRVLAVQTYRTPEMDYFSDKTAPFLNSLIDRYADAGVRFNALYSDEMHIQQDWAYHNHHDHGQFTLRYVSPGLARRFAAAYGPQYADFAKWLVYFAYGQEDTAFDLTATAPLMHVMAPTPEGVRQTALLRSRYYRLLQDGVVDLFTDAKARLEQRMGHLLETRAHATWAESPTCDRWAVTGGYEYTPDFMWSNTVHQAASACHDYFKWGDFLTGNGNDHAEGGYLDRNYYGIALACSTGVLNRVPNSYAAHWGMPHEVSRRRHGLTDAAGAAASPQYAMVQGMVHRDCDVLMLYPLDLVATEERFGSWTSLYGYTNYITQDKLIERGRVVGGGIELAGRRFTTLATQFEPLPRPELLTMMQQLAESGGRVIWSGPPPVIDREGKPVLDRWKDLCGTEYTPSPEEGIKAPARSVAFDGVLSGLPAMPILTDFIVDHVFFIAPRAGSQTIARAAGGDVGTHRSLPGGGSVTVLAFRPRDDQSGTFGPSRWWFEILDRLGAYPPSGRIAGVNDNPDRLSRTGSYYCCRFPNGTIAVAPHLYELVESWPGGFARDAKEDAEVVKRLKLPSEQISLKDFALAGHRVTYEGTHALAVRPGPGGKLLAFCGQSTNQITIDGKTTLFADKPMGQVAWAPVEEDAQVPGGAIMRLMIHGNGVVHIPAGSLPANVELVAQGTIAGSRGATIPCTLENGTLTFTAGPGSSGPWLYVVEKK